ncbi:hypothetical protein J4Q44_G00040220 [Coregonus suidteri]|uniref:Uncharacterized protein n=1 Tax=Coregonus suidteri TaxID=861788 RepID=A0AAN8R1B7_9TELE
MCNDHENSNRLRIVCSSITASFHISSCSLVHRPQNEKASLHPRSAELQAEKKPSYEAGEWTSLSPPSKISLKGASLLFTHVSQLHKLRLNVGMAVKLFQTGQEDRGGGATPLTLPELSLVLKSSQPPERVLSQGSEWCGVPAETLDGWTGKCFSLVCLQQSTHNITVDFRKNRLLEKNISDLLALSGEGFIFKSVDRMLLLSFLHCCAASQILQGATPTTAAAGLLRALQHRLDFSCSSSVDLQHSTQLVQNPTRNQSQNQPQPRPQVQLILKDCEVEHGALRELLPILHVVKLSPSKALLLQLVDHVCEGIEEGVLRHAESLCRALNGELDLSETRLNQKTCGSLALVLEHSEGLSELDLSHCQLTDHHLQPLLTHLHKVEVLDLSHNDITDALTDRILQLVSSNTSICTVRLFNNRINDRSPFLTDKRFEIW